MLRLLALLLALALPSIAFAQTTLTNPTSTLTLPAATTARAAGSLVANSATAGSVVVPTFAIANSGGGAIITKLRLSTNDATSTGWPGVTVQVDLWSGAAPTFTNGDGGAYIPATGTAHYIGSYSCTMSAAWGDGESSNCAPLVGTSSTVALASGTTIYWSLTNIGATGTVGASGVFTLTAELNNCAATC